MLAPRPARIALSLALLSGCYVGPDLEPAIQPGPTGAPETPSTGEAPTTGDAQGPGTTGELDEQDITGAVEPSTGEPATTEPATTEPATTEPATTEPATTDSSSDDSGPDDPPPPGPTDVPDSAHCAPVAGWAPAWVQLELDVLAIVNEKRGQGATCGGEGAFGPAGPLTMNPALRCAARLHSADMAARDFFDHTNPDGKSPWDRMAEAGYADYSAAGENIAAGSPDAAGTMDQWMNSDGHCANIMNPAFKEIGVGYSTGGQYGHLWTQVFGAQ